MLRNLRDCADQYACDVVFAPQPGYGVDTEEQVAIGDAGYGYWEGRGRDVHGWRRKLLADWVAKKPARMQRVRTDS